MVFHSRLRRQRRVIISALVALLAVGAFMLWGPIGLGNGRLDAGVYAIQGAPDLGGRPLAFIIPIHNYGDTPAVIDGVHFIGGRRWSAPRVLGLEVLT